MKKTLLLATLPLALAACGGLESDNDDNNDNNNNSAQAFQFDMIAVGPTADRSSASITLYNTEDKTSQTELNATDKTDVTLNAAGQNIYVINRYGANTITKYSASAPETAIWQCSTEGEDTNSNPYQILPVSDTKAYVLRYGTGKLWVVNPSIADSSKCDTEFKTGEIDLTSFDSDGVPDMASAVLVDGKAYIAMQRLSFFSPVETSQLAVIDTATDTLIDVDTSTDGTQAIDLGIKNVGHIEYSATAQKIYAQAIGKYETKDWTTGEVTAPAEYTGGIASVNPADDSVSLVVDDDDKSTQISDMAIISSTQGYFVGYAGYQNNTLFEFNPSTGAVTSETNGTYTAIAGISSENIAGIQKGPDNTLWMATTSGFKVIDTSTNTVTESLIDTKMNPSGFAFIED